MKVNKNILVSFMGIFLLQISVVYAGNSNVHTIEFESSRSNADAAVREFIASHVDVNGKKGKLLMNWAMEKGCIGSVKELFEAGFSIDNAMQVALNRGYRNSPIKAEIVSLLINAGADVNAKDRYQKTLLHFILYHSGRENNIVTIQRLLEAGANINAMDDRRITPLHEIARIYNCSNLPTDVRDLTILHLVLCGAELTPRIRRLNSFKKNEQLFNICMAFSERRIHAVNGFLEQLIDDEGIAEAVVNSIVIPLLPLAESQVKQLKDIRGINTRPKKKFRRS